MTGFLNTLGLIYFCVCVENWFLQYKLYIGARLCEKKFFYDFADIAIVMFSSKVITNTIWNNCHIPFHFFFHLDMPTWILLFETV